jgi:NTE family protein
VRDATVPRPLIGVALSGGTLKAAAHAGALESLREMGIRPDFVAGTSAGAVVAALYAHGYTHLEYLELIRHFPGVSLLDYGFPVSTSLRRLFGFRVLRRIFHFSQNVLPSGLIRGNRLRRYFQRALAGRTAEIPFFAMATDLVSGDPVVFSNYAPATSTGHARPFTSLEECLLASCALPGIFRPVCMDHMVLVDGAVRHYVPVYVLREMGCEKILVINLHTLERDWAPRHFFDVLSRSFDVLLRESIDDDVVGSNVMVIEPNVDGVNWTSFDRLESCFEAGRQAVYEKRQSILRWLRTPPIPDGSTGLKVRIGGGVPQ